MTYPSGRIVSYQRDSQGRVTGVSTQSAAGAATVTVASGGSYLPYGPLTGFTYGNGLAYSAGYDADYRIASQHTAQGATTVQSLQYGYDADSNITAITDNLSGARSQTLGYDALNRLTAASGAYGAYAYGYDAAGNRSSRTIGTGTPESYSYDPASSRLTAISGGATRSLGYAASGQITSDSRGAGQVYGYNLDAAGMMGAATLNGATLLSNVYDGDQHRVQKDVPGTSGYTAQYLYDREGHILGKAGPTGTPLRDYIWLGDKPIAQIDYNPLGFTQTAYLHTDQVNRPQKASNPNQTLAWDGVMGPFGEAGTATGSLTMNLGVPGQYLDRETGTYQNWHWDFDPGTGRYLQSDPIGLRGGINTYSYVNGNPIIPIDPLGFDGCDPRSRERDCYDRGRTPSQAPYVPAPGEWFPPLRLNQLPNTSDCKRSEWAMCEAKCPGRVQGCYVTRSWKLKGMRNGNPFRLEQRNVNCNCAEEPQACSAN